MLEIHVETTNSAFDDGNAGAELAFILRDLARSLENEDGSAIDIQSTLRDSNGNTVGHYTLKVSTEDFE